MKSLTIYWFFKYFFKGSLVTSFGVALIHLYSYLFENCFSYAEPLNILGTIVIGGIGFGMAIWGFENFKKFYPLFSNA